MLDVNKLKDIHSLFEDYIFEESGVQFNGWDNKQLLEDEIKYKWKVHYEAGNALQLNKWKNWIKKPGIIIKAVREACHRRNSSNLLIHNHGNEKGNSYKSLYRVKSSSQIKLLESQLYDFIGSPGKSVTEFGSGFNTFAEFLRKERLGCNWPFMSFLSFLYDVNYYFPIHPGRFDELLKYFGKNLKLSGSINWQSYLEVLSFAEDLKSNLLVYGYANNIQIHSYIWTISGLIGLKRRRVKPSIPDFNQQLEARIKIAAERETIGFRGEKYIFDTEKEYLKKNNHRDLAARVRMVSLDYSSCGYDILSFNLKGNERHIEVKTTQKMKETDQEFYLTENERQAAEKDLNWTLYRVYNINGNPVIEDLGNIIKNPHSNWQKKVNGWKFNKTI